VAKPPPGELTRLHALAVMPLDEQLTRSALRWIALSPAGGKEGWREKK